MSKKANFAILGVLGLLSLAAATGCSSVSGPNFGALNFPIPVSPFFQKEAEDKFTEYRRYDRMPILGPIPPGAPAEALDPPSHDQIMRALERANPVQGGLPLLYEIQRNNVRITVDLIQDQVDPPRVMPLVGPVQLHHAHYKCTIYYTELTRVGWPIPYTTTAEEAQEVIYIDHDHLHMVGNVDGGPGSYYQSQGAGQARTK
jgi:hypothetical protein